MSNGVATAISGLLATFTAAAPAGVAVIDGDPVDPPSRFLCVAWDESDDPTATSSLTSQDAGFQSDEEQIEVSNLVTVWSGSQTPAQVRADVFDVFDTFRSAIKADPSLGGVAGQARISAYEYVPSRRVEGFLAQIRFTVTVVAFTV